jgi:hypothetical protein
MGTEVYSWRLSSDLKSDLEREARLRKTSIAAVLNLAVRDWLKQSASQIEGDAEQIKLHQAVSECLGSIGGNDPYRSEKVRQTVRKRLTERRAR